MSSVSQASVLRQGMLTSGIVDYSHRSFLLSRQYYSSLFRGGWVWNLGVVGGVVWAHCWVLRDQAGPSRARLWRHGRVGGFWLVALVRAVACVVRRGGGVPFVV